MKRLAIAILVLLASPQSYAWGEKGHLLVNEAAVRGLPADMPPFFHGAYSDLVWLGYDPDRWKGGGESIDAVNDPDHFIDLEFTYGLELPRDRYKFLALMESSGRLRQKAITNDETGFLPWRITELCEKLTTLFRLWRNAHPSERAIIERDIINTAGVLGHYAGDGANPLHATINYNGWIEANPNRYANDCAIHSRFESGFVSHGVTLDDVTPKLAAPKRTSVDYFAAAMEFLKASNAQVETLYRIDRDGGFDLIKPAGGEGMAFATDRLAAGASLLRDLWWSAWKNSGEPRARRSR
jgi:hypothetical protein